MEKSLFAFIWRHSRRQQILLLVVTVLSFPLLYASLELPKRIINDAIGSVTNRVTVFGMELEQTEYLLILCVLFLVAVLAGGLVKMRLNTMKGALAERMLRRFRFQLLSRMLRFPKPYFRTTSQGELVSMIASEAEPMGGLMGDAVAQPVFQAGQMITIVTFLFLQSVWFGLASIALIPLQAWLIPMLQRQINLLNKERIGEVRELASEIGETAAGIGDLRANGGWRYRMALFTSRLGRLYEVRVRIYAKKFFMKFLNNFITHLTPFFFYLVGGLLAIRGEITVGALVAGLSAYKDIAAPWKELLFYYNQVQDMSLRWQIVTERFQPEGMIDEKLFDGTPDKIPRLTGDITLKNVTVRDEDGHAVLEDLNLTIPAGARVALKASNAMERTAFGELLTREILPARGSVTIGDRPLSELHQAVIAARIGYADSRPYLFEGTLGDNLLMPLRLEPDERETTHLNHGSSEGLKLAEAVRAGNSPDPLGTNWLNPGLAGLSDDTEINDWWFRLIEAMGLDEAILRRALRSYVTENAHPALTRALVGLRDEAAGRLEKRGLDDAVHRFDPETFNPSIPLGGNLLYAAPTREITQEGLAAEQRFMSLIRYGDLGEETLEISQAVIETLGRTFGRGGTDHPLFRRLGMEPEMFLRLSDIIEKRRARGDKALKDDEVALLITVPFLLTAEQIGPGFPQRYKDRILAMRKAHLDTLRKHVGDLFQPVEPDAYLTRMTLLENILYGRVSRTAGARGEEIEDAIVELLTEKGLRGPVAAIFFDLPTGIGGAALPTVLHERAALGRAAIKRPDIIVLDNILASHDADQRQLARRNLRNLFPAATIIVLEPEFDETEEFDLRIEISDGRLDGLRQMMPSEMSEESTEDFLRKLRFVRRADVFHGIDARNQRLLAFSAQWFDATPGQVVFRAGQSPDAVYLCVEGKARIFLPGTEDDEPPLSIVGPGRLIGDLAVLVDEPRQIDLVAETATRFLRISAEDFRAVISADADVAVALLREVAGHLSSATELLSEAQAEIARLTVAPPLYRGDDADD